ncbi:MAG: hypothetical protein EP298_06815 [Gammaproteobacteria bacterium]|nr:MAG: hypothetical protein EP298_06815 [Gammaproteobacteria bacterium]UTW42943.1 hypothetical protein KFE69_02040 [bacterium SCSIO 12844]
MTDYKKIFDDALENYSSSTERPGYTSGWFTWLRHDNKMYDHIQDLKDQLSSSTSDEKSIQILQNYFKSDETTFNNHSFSLYLIDALEANCPNDGWDEYYPQGKKVKFYIGEIYRGTLQHPNSAFKVGMSASSSKSIEDYTPDTSGGTGISTAKDRAIAKEYSHTTTQIAAKGQVRVDSSNSP